MRISKCLLFIIICFPLLCLGCIGGGDAIAAESAENTKEVGSGEIDGYKLVWQDLFNGDKLSPDNWYIEVNGQGGGNAELQFYKAENVSIDIEPNTGKRCLVLTAKKENYLDKTATSGRVNSIDRKTFKYGKIEASIKVPKTGDGLWPAFWMMGADYPSVGWPKCGEVDILEIGSDEGIRKMVQDYFINGACHWGQSWNGGAYPNYFKGFENSYVLHDDFHLYTLTWDRDSIRMYLDKDKYPDAKPYFEMGINSFDTESSPGHYFNKDFFILFNLAVGGNYTQIWDINKVTALNEENGYEAKMYVDYVRVYQKEEFEDNLLTNK
ncbi:family 16 glycosylhydrolase [Dysgonomonas sp. 520]|uniref:glycoside hydrolase family 16 protein n=1 Tax=Dysgonomonas sp. 520 TaxID=2302931 RepID=UPI0013D3513A|nr:glycoside hydrolase family 16 protein [Dysgonomonas sp. 520]NDW08731.1 glycoside hydrolase family 16 protein [Dysgonomonas sp. 520]